MHHEQDTTLAGPGHRLGGTTDGLGGYDGALHRPAHPDQRPARQRRAETVDHQRVPAGDGRAAARRGHARRPHRPQADVPHRPGPVRIRVPPGRVRSIPAGADRRPGLPCGRGGGDAARHPVTDPHHLRRRPRARHRHWRLGHHGGTRRRAGPDRRRPAASALLVGLGLPPQHPRRAARPGRDGRSRAGRLGPPRPPLGPDRLPAGHDRPGRPRLRHPGSRQARPDAAGDRARPAGRSRRVLACSHAASAARPTR